jgi:parallel beta-helix repeat protein
MLSTSHGHTDIKQPYHEEVVVTSNPDLPIYANGNAQLASVSTSGTGTSLDPYIIENLIINGSTYIVEPIEIRNTNDHLIIRNCTLFDSNYVGIYLSNVTNVLVINNTVSDTDEISIYDSNNITVQGNNIINNNDWGLAIFNTDNSVISDNVLQNNNNVQGILVSSTSENNIIKNNKISGSHQIGIYVIGNSHYNYIL